MPTYGRGLTLVDASNNGMYAPAKGAAIAGKFTRTAGFKAYYEVCQVILVCLVRH